MATQNGFLYVYDVSEVEGGECKLIVKHNLRSVDTQPIKIQGKQFADICLMIDSEMVIKFILFEYILIYKLIDTQSNGSPLDNSPSTTTGSSNHGPSYASTVKAGTSDDDQ